MKALTVTVENFEQGENEDTVIVELDTGNTWYIQRLNGRFNQMMGCQVSMDGNANPDFDEEAEFAVSIADSYE